MSLYLKKFQTTAQYNAYTADTSNFILPNVSVCEDAQNTVHYHPYVDPYNGHEYVDLGLPSGTKWAKMNVGATSETEYGNYYQYGKGTDDYFVTSGQSSYSGTESPLATSADTAAQVMGGQWHMPTQEQINELTANTTYQWTTINYIRGGMFTSKTDTTKYVFFPAAGMWYGMSKVGETSYAYCCSSTPRVSGGGYFTLDANRNGGKLGAQTDFYGGISVRGVVG